MELQLYFVRAAFQDEFYSTGSAPVK